MHLHEHFQRVVAIVSWFSPHPQCPAVDKPVEVWYNELEGVHSFVPTKSVHSAYILNVCRPS